MKKLLIAGLSALALMGQAAPPPKPSAEIKLWRLSCGPGLPLDLGRFNDTGKFDGQKREFVISCYLIKHGDKYLLWDTGLSTKPGEADPILAQLTQIGVKASDIGAVGISHYHYDHTAWAKDFPAATLLIGKGDFDALSAKPPLGMADPKPLSNWIGGSGKSEAVSGDKDVFGDGSVTMLDMPGHTPGHHALLVRLPKTGPVLLSGDQFHFLENIPVDGVPGFNTDRAQTLASNDRFKKLAANLNARVIIQHDQRDVAKLPLFPAAAE